MKLRLLILLAAALAAAPAAGQTIKSLGYNTTNGNIVAATNVTFTNSLGFATNARATTRTNLGLGGSDSVTFSNLSLSGNGSLAIGGMNLTAISSGIDLAFKRAGSTELELKTNGLVLHVGSYSFSGGNTNGASTTRANLGLGATNYPTFAGIEIIGQDEMQLNGASIDAVGFGGKLDFEEQRLAQDSQTVFIWETNSFAVTPSATFATNVSVAGSLTATGNATLNGSGNLAPSQTASSGSSLMTRVLTDNNPIQTVGTVRPLGAYAFNTANSGVAGTDHAFGGANVRSGTNTNGYGRALLYRGLNDNNNFTGGGIVAQNMSVSFLWAINDAITTNSFARFIVGGTGTGAVAPANSNALSTRGFGVEITRTSTTNVWPASTLRARLFAHDGTNYYTSSYTDDFFAFNNQHQFIINYTTNGLVTLQTSSANRAPSRPSATPVLTLTNGPTTAFGGAYIEWVAVNRSDIAPATQLHTIYYGGMVEVKD